MKNLTIFNISKVRFEHESSGALFADVRAAADLYGVFDDLFGPDRVFTPVTALTVEHACDEEDDEAVMPVRRGT